MFVILKIACHTPSMVKILVHTVDGRNEENNKRKPFVEATIFVAYERKKKN